jgi:hypothetical protein
MYLYYYKLTVLKGHCLAQTKELSPMCSVVVVTTKPNGEGTMTVPISYLKRLAQCHTYIHGKARTGHDMDMGSLVPLHCRLCTAVPRMHTCCGISHTILSFLCPFCPGLSYTINGHIRHMQNNYFSNYQLKNKL